MTALEELINIIQGFSPEQFTAFLNNLEVKAILKEGAADAV